MKIIFIIATVSLLIAGCQKPFNEKQQYFECLADISCQNDWEIALQNKEGSPDTIFIVSTLHLYYTMLNKKIIKNRDQYITCLKTLLNENKFSNIRSVVPDSSMQVGTYFTALDAYSKSELYDKFIDKNNYILTIVSNSDTFPSLIVALQRNNLFVKREDYSGLYKVYSTGDVKKIIEDCKNDFPN